MDKIKNPSERKIKLLPERLKDTSKLTEVILDNVNITVSEIEKDRYGNPVLNPTDLNSIS